MFPHLGNAKFPHVPPGHPMSHLRGEINIRARGLPADHQPNYGGDPWMSSRMNQYGTRQRLMGYVPTQENMALHLMSKKEFLFNVFRTLDFCKRIWTVTELNGALQWRVWNMPYHTFNMFKRLLETLTPMQQTDPDAVAAAVRMFSTPAVLAELHARKEAVSHLPPDITTQERHHDIIVAAAPVANVLAEWIERVPYRVPSGGDFYIPNQMFFRHIYPPEEWPHYEQRKAITNWHSSQSVCNICGIQKQTAEFRYKSEAPRLVYNDNGMGNFVLCPTCWSSPRHPITALINQWRAHCYHFDVSNVANHSIDQSNFLKMLQDIAFAPADEMFWLTAGAEICFMDYGRRKRMYTRAHGNVQLAPIFDETMAYEEKIDGQFVMNRAYVALMEGDLDTLQSLMAPEIPDYQPHVEEPEELPPPPPVPAPPPLLELPVGEPPVPEVIANSLEVSVLTADSIQHTASTIHGFDEMIPDEPSPRTQDEVHFRGALVGSTPPQYPDNFPQSFPNSQISEATSATDPLYEFKVGNEYVFSHERFNVLKVYKKRGREEEDIEEIPEDDQPDQARAKLHDEPEVQAMVDAIRQDVDVVRHFAPPLPMMPAPGPNLNILDDEFPLQPPPPIPTREVIVIDDGSVVHPNVNTGGVVHEPEVIDLTLTPNHTTHVTVHEAPNMDVGTPPASQNLAARYDDFQAPDAPPPTQNPDPIEEMKQEASAIIEIVGGPAPYGDIMRVASTFSSNLLKTADLGMGYIKRSDVFLQSDDSVISDKFTLKYSDLTSFLNEETADQFQWFCTYLDANPQVLTALFEVPSFRDSVAEEVYPNQGKSWEVVYKFLMYTQRVDKIAYYKILCKGLVMYSLHPTQIN